jgi:hypothetical protein
MTALPAATLHPMQTNAEATRRIIGHRPRDDRSLVFPATSIRGRRGVVSRKAIGVPVIMFAADLVCVVVAPALDDVAAVRGGRCWRLRLLCVIG